MRGTLIFLVVLLWCGGLYYGYMTFIQKAMSQTKVPENEEAESMRQRQSRQAEETRLQQKRLMEDRERRLRMRN